MAGVKGMKGGGGKRPGAGRKPSPKILMPEVAAPPTDDATDNATPVIEIQRSDEPASLAFLRAVIEHPGVDVRLRLEAAKALAPYEAVRKDAAGKRKDAADAAKKAGTGKFAPSAPPRSATVLPFQPKNDGDRE